MQTHSWLVSHVELAQRQSGKYVHLQTTLMYITRTAAGLALPLFYNKQEHACSDCLAQTSQACLSNAYIMTVNNW